MNTENQRNKVTVVIPVYNVKSYLKRCLDSVLNQTYQKLEIIIIDDGSDDGSEIICDDYKKLDNRIRVYHQKNQGLSAARNQGLKMSTGDFIAFVDSDDWIEPDMMEYLQSALMRYQADIAVCGWYTVEEKRRRRYGFSETKIMKRDEALRELCEDTQIKNYVCNKMFRQHIFEKIKFPIGKKFEDIYVMYQCFENAEYIVALKEAKYFYFIREDSITQQRSDKNNLERCIGHEYRYRDLEKRYPELLPELSRQFFYVYRKYRMEAGALGWGKTNADIMKFYFEIYDCILKNNKMTQIEKKEANLLKEMESTQFWQLRILEFFRKLRKFIYLIRN